MKNWILVVISFLLLAVQPLQVQAKGYGHQRHTSSHSGIQYENKIEVTIIDEYGYRLPLYETDGGYQLKKSYMQALRNQQYSIEVRNKTPRRVGFVIAVDGRNIITGKASYLKSREKMYILNPFEVSTFRGWRSSGNTINRFYFTDEQHSYSAAFNDYSAMGVIAVAAFYEKKPKHPPHNISKRSKNRKPDSRSAARSQPGTGWGDTESSPTTQVKFVAQKRPFTKHLIKYEWHKRLCDMDIIHCHGNSHRLSHSHSNRLWDSNSGYATPPPSHRRRVRVGY